MNDDIEETAYCQGEEGDDGIEQGRGLGEKVEG